MSGFSPEWLALREPVDHRSRAEGLARQVRATFADRGEIRVRDLGCGTGSNLRGTYALLPERQAWTLVDYDPRLLDAARTTLGQWADTCSATREGLQLRKGRFGISVAFEQRDLVRDLDGALGTASAADLVTASAFFDLCAASFIDHFAAAVAARRMTFYTVLTYNGDQRWTPVHAADAAMNAAFHSHQRTDKGFGPAAGPDAARSLATAFAKAGYQVTEGDSPWVLGAADIALTRDLAQGFAGAVRETGIVAEADVAAWSAVARTGAIVGHTDTFARPSA